MGALIFLARHGSHAELGAILSGRSHIELSPEGHGQAQRLARACLTRGVTAVHSSPCRRAWRTAEIVADHLGVACDPVTALDEIDFGAWAGRSFADLDADQGWRHWNDARHAAAAPGGESMTEATTRIVGHLEHLAAAGASHILCVSHCDMIRAAVAHYLGLGLDKLLRFDVDPGSLSTLLLEDQGGRGRLLGLNEVPR